MRFLLRLPNKPFTTHVHKMAKPLRLSTTSPTFEADFKARLHWSADTDAAIEQRVADILAECKSVAMPLCWSTPSVLTA